MCIRDSNCFVLATAEGEECVVVDPGIGVTDTLSEVLRELRLRPAAVLLTHGHLDHVYSVTPVCRGGGAAAYIHGDDRYRLRDPLADLDRGMIAMMEAQFGERATWTEPDDIRELRDGDSVTIAGMAFGIVHAPGHTEGCLLYTSRCV